MIRVVNDPMTIAGRLRPVLLRLGPDGVQVDQEGLRVDAVGGHVVQPAREVDLHAVREVAAVGEVETEDVKAEAKRTVEAQSCSP